VPVVVVLPFVARMVMIVAGFGIVVCFVAMFVTMNVIVGMPMDQVTVSVFMTVTVPVLMLMGFR
jgi:hypothetical protein